MLYFRSTIKGSQELPTELKDEAPVSALKTFHAKTVQSLSDCEIPTSSEFRPIQSLSEHEGYQSSSEVDKLAALNKSETNIAVNTKPNNNKKKRRRKKKTLTNELKKESTDKIDDEDEDKEKLVEENAASLTHDLLENVDSNKTNLMKV